MPKRVSSAELDLVKRALAKFPSGASIEQIARSLVPAVPRRTLHRRLDDLIANGAVTVHGSGRATRCLLAAERAREAKRPTELRLSRRGEVLRAAIRAPIHQRKPIGHNRAFLDEYEPNTTFYLSESQRRDLAEAGRSSDADMPAGTYARQIFDRLLIDLSWNSSRLEGNTYSLLETERLIKLGQSA